MRKRLAQDAGRADGAAAGARVKERRRAAADAPALF
jgi:hypothetical protein